MIPIPLHVHPDGTFRATVMAEAGRTSAVVKHAWVTFGSTWGSSTVVITALDDRGAVMRDGRLEARVENNRRVVLKLPSGVVMATVEGRSDPGAVPAAGVAEIDRDYD